jgi:hypothetical protein
MHELVVDENLPATARSVSTVEREMAVSAEQLFAAFEDEPEAFCEGDDAHPQDGGRSQDR